MTGLWSVRIEVLYIYIYYTRLDGHKNVECQVEYVTPVQSFADAYIVKGIRIIINIIIKVILQYTDQIEKHI